jgi:hypothetical protein
MSVKNSVLLPLFKITSTMSVNKHTDEMLVKELSHTLKSDIRNLVSWLKAAIRYKGEYKYLEPSGGRRRSSYIVTTVQIKRILGFALTEQTGRSSGDRTLQPR